MNRPKRQKLEGLDENFEKFKKVPKQIPRMKNNSQKSSFEESKNQDKVILTSANDNSALQQIKHSTDIPDTILSIEKQLSEKLKDLSFKSPVEYIYNPLEYAFDVHSNYVKTYCQNTKKILFLGMNPGPWGMSQTGVPFGEICMVRDWLKVSGKVGKPDRQHEEREVTGFECKRSEVSGSRFWGFFRELCDKPEILFRYGYVHNYCPLAFMAKNARNITPADLKGEEQKKLLALCDDALKAVIGVLNVEIVIGIGRFAEERAKLVVQNGDIKAKVIYMAHPSPRVVNNENWPDKAKKFLEDHNLLQYFKK